MSKRHYLFDWGDTLMADMPACAGPMCDWPKVRAMQNAQIALRALSRASGCHLVTNARDSAAGQIRAALSRVGLDAYLVNIYCYRQVGFRKPSARFFNFILDDLGVDRSSLVLVGDDLEKDVLGAAKCGIEAIWYNPSDSPAPNGVRCIQDLCDLLPAPKTKPRGTKLNTGDGKQDQ